jgi:hypothetical protein
LHRADGAQYLGGGRGPFGREVDLGKPFVQTVHQKVRDFDADAGPFVERNGLEGSEHLPSEKLSDPIRCIGVPQRHPLNQLSVNPGELRLKRLSKNGLVKPGGKLVTHAASLPY